MLYIIAGLFVCFHIVYTAYFIKKYLRFKKIEKKSEKHKNKNKTNNNLKEKKQIPNNNNNNNNSINNNSKPIHKNNQLNNFIIKNEKENDGVKYRNLTESPNGSNLNIKPKINQKISEKY
jgi:hypothetical protein